jgi:hydroxymethylbilane synthase
MGGGCLLPIAAFGKLEGEHLLLTGLVASPNGESVIREKVRGAIAEADELGKRLAEIIMEKGGKKLLEMGCSGKTNV